MFAAVEAPGLEPKRYQELVACAGDFSPQVEKTSATTIVFPVTGLARWYPTAEALARAVAVRAGRLESPVNVALAESLEVALAAARGLTGVTVIPRGREEAILAPLPVEVLAASLFGDDRQYGEMLMTLESWGVRTCGELAALPPLGVLERLGAAGLRLLNLARGMADRPFRPATAPAEYRERTQLEYPVALLEPLLFLVADQLNRLCARLDAQSMATGHLELSLELEGAAANAAHVRTYRLPVPTRDARALLKLIHLDLEANPPAAPVTLVALWLAPVKPRVLQNDLFQPRAPEPEKLELTLQRIARIVGPGQVGSPRLVDTHRPGAFTLARLNEAGGAEPVASGRAALCARLGEAGGAEPVAVGRAALCARLGEAGGAEPVAVGRAALCARLFRPPLAARVEMEAGRPARVAARGLRGGRVAVWAGPWRSAGDWWTAEPWSREEWDLELEGGALYRLYRDPAAGWFVEGEYD